MDNDASRMISNQLTCDTSRVAYTVPPVPNLILPRLPAERSCIHTPIVVRVQPGRGVPPPVDHNVQAIARGTEHRAFGCAVRSTPPHGGGNRREDQFRVDVVGDVHGLRHRGGGGLY